jgi:hypothetical protein
MNMNLISMLAAGTLLASPIVAMADGHDDHGGNHGHQNGGDHDKHDRYDNDRHDNDHHDNDHYDHGHHDNGNHYGNHSYAVVQPQHDWHNYRHYDYNRLPPGERVYYPDRYYRSGTYYQTRYLGPTDRIYRGQDNRYYCRRSDGTTGLIIGGLAGGSFGAAIAPGGSQTLGALLGGTMGALLGHSIDSNQISCR